jgi:hypothetical protein
MVVTEKIDGTNAQIAIDDLPDGTRRVRAGSRTRWIAPEQDNFGFARWVKDHEEELKKLGRGRHYGEWWGLGIGRGYGQTTKRFSLFNTARPKETLPECCEQVPVLYTGPLDMGAIDRWEQNLRANGSVAAPGFMRPEGVCIYIPATGHIFKHPFDK